MLAWLVVGSSLPLFVALTPNNPALQAVATSSHAADLGGYLISTPVMLAQQPRVALERGTLYGADARLPKDFGQKLTSGMLLMSDGEIRISAGAAGLDAAIETVTGAVVHPLLGQLARQSFTTLALRRTTLLITLPDGETEAVRDVTGELKRGRNGWQFKGDGLIMGQRTALDVLAASSVERRGQSGVTQAGVTQSVVTAPLKFTVKNALLDWTFDGRIGLNKAFQMVGSTDVDLTVAPHLPWLSRLLPDGMSALGAPLGHNLKAKGALDWSTTGMALSNAKFEMDGNQATGALSLDRRPKRPVIAGTLAFQTLDLTRHLPQGFTTQLQPVVVTEAAKTIATPGVIRSGAGFLTGMAATLMQSWGSADREMPLISLIDADLRVSSDKLVLGPVTLRRTAATVSNHGGKLLADVAAFEFDAGRGAGQISGDFTGPTMKIGLRGRLDNLDAVKATAALFGTSFIEGRGFVTVDLTGTGTSLNEVVRSAQGRVSTGIPDGGRIAVDLRGLAAASQKRAVEGWSAGGRDQLSFDGLEAVFELTKGVLSASDQSQVRVRDDVIKLTGTIDMLASQLNLTARGPLIGFSSETPSALQISGPWARPTVRLDATRKAASATATGTSPKP